MRGLNYEDGIIVSESYARKMTSTSVVDVTIDIEPGVIVEGYVDVGAELKPGDKLVGGTKVKKMKGSYADLVESLNLDSKSKFEWGKYAPSKMSVAIVQDLQIYKGDEEADESTEYILNEGRSRQYDKASMFKDFIDIAEDVPLLPKSECPKGYTYRMQYRLVTYSYLKEGDKLTNRYGSKGVVSKVLPDNEMPLVQETGQRIEVVLHPNSIVNRKNPSQLIEMDLISIGRKLLERHKTLISSSGEIPYGAIRDDLKKYKLSQYLNMNDEELHQFIDKSTSYVYITGSISDLVPKEIYGWLDELGIDGLVTLIDGKTNRKVRNKIKVGYLYMVKLYFLADSYATVTKVSSTDARTLVLGKGKLTKGSKFGNMEMDAIFAHNFTEYIDYVREGKNIGASFLANTFLSGIHLVEDSDELIINDDDE
jgi:DNA-directed RNA polymerase beta subunit